MKSEAAGSSTLEVEVTQIDWKGVWLLIGESFCRSNNFLGLGTRPLGKSITLHY